MKRRENPDEVLPRWLREPSPEDWPEGSCHWQCRYHEAVSAWIRANPDVFFPADLPRVDGPWHPELI